MLGLGIEILTDDGIGSVLSKIMSNKFNNSDMIFKTNHVGGLELLEIIDGFKTVVFIDAVNSKNGIPGIVHYYSLNNFRETSHLSNIHDASFLSSLKFGKQIGMDLPEDIYIIAIEIDIDNVFSMEFSDKIRKSFTEIIESIKGILCEINNKKTYEKSFNF